MSTPVRTPTCDPAADPKDAPACVQTHTASFVDGQNGNDTYPGTRELPVKSICPCVEHAWGSGARLSLRDRAVCGDRSDDEERCLRASMVIHVRRLSLRRVQGCPSPRGVRVRARRQWHVRGRRHQRRGASSKDEVSPEDPSIAVFAYAAARVTLRRGSVTPARVSPAPTPRHRRQFSPIRAQDGAMGARRWSHGQPDVHDEHRRGRRARMERKTEAMV